MVDYSLFSKNIACITSEGTSYTYHDLDNFTQELSKCMMSRSLCFILCSNTIGSLVGYLSALRSDTVALLLNKDIENELLQNLIDVYKPAYLWLPVEKNTHYEGLECFSDWKYSLLKLNNSFVEIGKELSLLLTTSGTTGSPKLVRLSKKNLVANADSIIKYLHINENEKAVTSLPMYYSFGLSVINSHLKVGATLLLTDYSYIQKEFWDFVIDNGITSFAGVPYTYEILEKMRFWRRNIPTLKTMTQAGGKLNNNLIEHFAINAREKDIDFYVMYGQTEATARMSYLPASKTLEKLGSIGVSIPNGRFEVVGDSGVINNPHVVGELVYKGENVCLGYAESLSDLQKGDENASILYTGDLAYFDEDGYYYIAGRKKRFLKLYGNRVSLDNVESLLKGKYVNVDFACVGTDDKMIVYTTSMDLNADILSYLLEKLQLNKNAFEIRRIDVIPHSDSGKVQYASLSNV